MRFHEGDPQARGEGVGNTQAIIYLIDGEAVHGYPREYVRAREQGGLSDIEVSPQVWTVEVVDGQPQLTELVVETESTGYNEDDWASVTVRIPVLGFEGRYTVDGRV